jgi:hypothetical protein
VRKQALASLALARRAQTRAQRLRRIVDASAAGQRPV